MKVVKIVKRLTERKNNKSKTMYVKLSVSFLEVKMEKYASAVKGYNVQSKWELELYSVHVNKLTKSLH